MLFAPIYFMIYNRLVSRSSKNCLNQPKYDQSKLDQPKGEREVASIQKQSRFTSCRFGYAAKLGDLDPQYGDSVFYYGEVRGQSHCGFAHYGAGVFADFRVFDHRRGACGSLEAEANDDNRGLAQHGVDRVDHSHFEFRLLADFVCGDVRIVGGEPVFATVFT